MEKFHPFLYIDIFPALADFPNVTYTWTVMVVVLLVSFLTTRALQVITMGKLNVLETLFDAVFSFMEGPLGEEGKKYLFKTTVLFYEISEHNKHLNLGFFR